MNSSEDNLPKGWETVLVVEDEPAVRALLLRVLSRLGYALLEASNGHEAAQKLHQHSGPVHLLLTDLVMPEMGGRELAQSVRKTRPEMRILYISGYAEEEEGLEADTSFLEKPFTPAELASKVRAALDGAFLPSAALKDSAI